MRADDSGAMFLFAFFAGFGACCILAATFAEFPRWLHEKWEDWLTRPAPRKPRSDAVPPRLPSNVVLIRETRPFDFDRDGAA